jgi:hypothetical protein
MAPAGVHDTAQAYEKPEVFAKGEATACRSGEYLSSVMRGLAPRIHVFSCFKTWMAGTSPAMTISS